MHLNSGLYGGHVCLTQGTHLVFEPTLICSHYLIGHRFAWFASKRYQRFPWIEATCIAGERYHHNPRQISVTCIIADDDGWP
jgi:hypothetical protein